MGKIIEPERELTVRMSVDVLVVGGGPAGIIAAMAAAEDGLKVAIVENRSFLGGNMTIGIPILGFLGQKRNQIIEGLPQIFVNRLAEMEGASEHIPCPLHMSITYIEPEVVKVVAFEVLKECGVEILLYTLFADVIMDDGNIKGIVIESKAGREVILAKVIIDCTGDADVAFRAGVPCKKGGNSGGMQPATLMFSMAGVDKSKLNYKLVTESEIYYSDFIPSSYYATNPDNFIVVGLRNIMQKAKAEGIKLSVERTIIITGLKKGETWINMSKVDGLDGTDPVSLTNGEYFARHQINEVIKYLKLYVPGFENASLLRIAPFIGIRETRRIAGQYILTRDDILSCRRFDDAIAVAGYPIDLHQPIGGDCLLEWCGDSYEIPYRSLVPEHVGNLLVAGRNISTTHEAMAAIRVMATCMAIGEAAGRAAKLAVHKGIMPSAINVDQLRSELLAKGAYLKTVK